MKHFKSILIATACAVTFTGTALAESKIMLKTPIFYNSVLPGLGSSIKYVADNIGDLSGNTLKMKIYEPNKLVHPKEILDAVSTGKVQAGYATGGNWGGKIPAARLFSSVPFDA